MLQIETERDIERLRQVALLQEAEIERLLARLAELTRQLAEALGEDAIQALQLASEHRPDLIIMDIQLPDLDGISAALTLKGDPETRHIPIVAMTAYDIAGDQARTLSKVCVAYYQKPIRPHDLVNLVTAILKLPPESPPAARRPSPARPPGR